MEHRPAGHLSVSVPAKHEELSLVTRQEAVAESRQTFQLRPCQVAGAGSLMCSVVIGRHPERFAEHFADAMFAFSSPRQEMQRSAGYRSHDSVAEMGLIHFFEVEHFRACSKTDSNYNVQTPTAIIDGSVEIVWSLREDLLHPEILINRRTTKLTSCN